MANLAKTLMIVIILDTLLAISITARSLDESQSKSMAYDVANNRERASNGLISTDIYTDNTEYESHLEPQSKIHMSWVQVLGMTVLPWTASSDTDNKFEEVGNWIFALVFWIPNVMMGMKLYQFFANKDTA